tara:strand:- start:124 stop:420 length:297 start_codon:yes stop_codon:yes gene_type:complete
MLNSNSIQKLESSLSRAWTIVDDIDDILHYVGDDPFFMGMKAEHQDKLMNLLIGIKELAEVKMSKTWTDFEAVNGDYYKYLRASQTEGEDEKMVENLG